MRRVLAVALASIVALLVGAAVANAQTITVTGTGDGTGTGGCPTSACLLRQAVNYADSDSQADTIVLGAHTYTLTSSNGPLDIDSSHPVTITGAGAASTTITQSGTTELLEVNGSVATITGVNFTDGDATGSGTEGGEGGAIENEGTLSLTSDDFTDNTALNAPTPQTYGGEGGEGGAIINDGVLTVTGCAFTGNDADGGLAGSSDGGEAGEAGAIFDDVGSELTVGTSSFDDNQALRGAGASVAYGEGEAGEGGALYDEDAVVTISSSTFGTTTPNQAQASTTVTASGTYGGEGGEGGAIQDDSTDTTLDGDTFAGNRADGAPSGNESEGEGGEGGAIDAYDGALTINGGSFSGNEAYGATSSGSVDYGEAGEGGAIYVGGTVAIVSNATFTSNVAGGGGEGVGDDDGGDGGEGGALAVYGGELVLSGGTFTSNSADGGTPDPGEDNYDTQAEGGALYLSAAAQVSDSRFTSNSATALTNSGAYGGEGGAAFVEYQVASFTGDTFTTNSAEPGGNGGSIDGGSGGALLIEYGGALDVTGSTASGNTATNGYGGAISAGALLSVSDSTLSGNSAESGGALYTYANPASLVNTTVYANTAEETPAGDGNGGGIYLDSGVVNLDSDSIVANSVYGSDDGGNIYQDDGLLVAHDTLVVRGSLLGSGSSGGENCSPEGDINITDLGYNFEDRDQCGFGSSGDLVNQSDADLGTLASNGGPTETVALLAGSSSINAGDPAGCTDQLGNVLSTDQRGEARSQGGRCDIGAYEYTPPASPAPPSPGPVAPVLSGLVLQPGVFLSLAGGGSTIVYDDSEAATTSFKVTGHVAGYKKKKKKGTCKALPKGGKRPKHSKACTMTFTAATFSHNDVAGANSVFLSGRPSGKKLPKGSYTLSATPTFDGLTGAIETTKFTIAS